MITRRWFLGVGGLGLTGGLAGCAGGAGIPQLDGLFSSNGDRASTRSGETLSRPNYAQVYGTYPGEPFPVKPFNYKAVDPLYLRQQVAYRGPEQPGTIVVDPSARQLFFVEPEGRATRYGVGVGREGFAWAGKAQINMRRSWPDWVPPAEMVERDPTVRTQLVQTPRGMGVPGGSRNPLGARAMYLFSTHGEGDLGYRIHGTTEPETIGTNVSSGCVRMVNQDVIHLYGRAPDGTTVVVLQSADAKRVG